MNRCVHSRVMLCSIGRWRCMRHNDRITDVRRSCLPLVWITIVSLRVFAASPCTGVPLASWMCAQGYTVKNHRAEGFVVKRRIINFNRYQSVFESAAPRTLYSASRDIYIRITWLTVGSQWCAEYDEENTLHMHSNVSHPFIFSIGG